MGTQISIGLDTVALTVAILGGLAALWRFISRRRSFVSGLGQVYIGKPEGLRRPLFGRAQELTAIVEQLDSGKTVIVLGVAGIGKSTLGKAAAAKLDEPHRRLVWIRCTSDTDLRSFVDMFSLHLKTAYQETVLREAYEKYEAHDATQWVDLLADTLSRHRYAFFVDDFHLVKDQVVVSELLPRLCATVNTLIMTRELDATTQSAIGQVTILAETRLQGLPDADAVNLLRQVGLIQEAKEDLLKLAQRLNGHPKALEICAGLVRDTHLKVSVTQLVTGPMLGKDPKRWLEQTLRFSDSRLSRAERRMMMACAAFFEPFTHDDILAVCRVKDGAEVLSRLQNRCLVDSTNQGTLSLHPLVQEYYEELGRRTYGIRIRRNRGRGVSVTIPERVYWLISLSGFPFRESSLLSSIRYLIGKYLQAQGTDDLETRKRCIRYLSAVMALDEIVEIERSQFLVRKHPFTMFMNLPSALLIAAFWVGLSNLALPVLSRTGLPWIGDLMQRRILFSLLVAAICVLAWLWQEIVSIRKSYIIITADRSLCMKDYVLWRFFMHTGLSWLEAPCAFGWLGFLGRYETQGEHILLEPRRFRFFGRELRRLLLLRKKSRRKGKTLYLTFGFIDRPETQYQALMQALRPAIPPAEQAHSVGSARQG